MLNENSISICVNNRKYTVTNVDPTLSLNSWLRTEVGLFGTKWMCNEGGCGSCVILLQYPSHKAKSVNSCLVPLASADGCNVFTIEGCGSNQSGFNMIQSQIALRGASQCGYCTPGFVMSMHGLLEKNPSPTLKEIENNFDGNMCRCTGYRSILDAMKSFAADGSGDRCCTDIEDLIPVQRQFKKKADSPSLQFLKVINSSTTWVRPLTFHDLKSFMKETLASFKFICGNTGSGVYKSTKPYSIYIDISQIDELKAITDTTETVQIGASVSLNELADILEDRASHSVTFAPVAAHIKRIANNPVRNCGSWAGNVMLKHTHEVFPSDICTLLEACDAILQVYDFVSETYSSYKIYGSNGIIGLNMEKKVIVSMTLPKVGQSEGTKMKTFKITPRAQNAHAYVNAAFVASCNDGRLSKVRLVFGGITASFNHASATENYLTEKAVNSNDTLKESLRILSNEISASCTDTYKINLALGLFYKFYLSLCDRSQLGPGIASGIDSLQRPVSTGTQVYKTDPSTYPVSKDIPKFSGAIQASGEAEFVGDAMTSRHDLYCDVVLSTVGNCEIEAIDFAEAQRVPGSVQVIATGENFPDDVKNAFHPWDPTQPLIASSYVSHAGQVLAVVIADSVEAARRMSAAVKVAYKNKRKPILTSEDAIQAGSFYDVPLPDIVTGSPDVALASAKHVVSGEQVFGHQYHFYMETLYCKAQRTDEQGLRIVASTQSQTDLQYVLSHAFDVPTNKIEISTKRLGGAYGGKAGNSFQISCIAALAAHVTNRPVHFHTTLETCMKMLGTRTPYTVKYQVGFDDDGILTAVDANVYCNSGCSAYDAEADDNDVFTFFADSAYYCPNRRYKRHIVKTNLPSSSWCRAPGSLQMTASADLMVEHVASYLGKDPIDVKLANLYKVGQTNFKETFRQESDIIANFQNFLSKHEIRERSTAIDVFNQSNRWKKKGIAVTPMKYIIGQWAKHGVLMSIYARDGTVLVSHGGIDSGQGINTKVIQAVAYKLGIPVEMVTVQRTSTITSANSSATGGSIASECVCQSAIECCDVLNERINKVRSGMDASSTWKSVIARCYDENVDLSVTRMSPPLSDKTYSLFGIAAAEVDYDVISGERHILRVDTSIDCGVSLNPNVDIGQVEGAFMMGVGFWLTEKMVYDQTTGLLLSDGTWEYKPPSSQDIPIQWNIELMKDAPNPNGVLRSKATGEPGICVAIVVALALKRAVEAARRDRGITSYFPLPTPATVDALHNNIGIDPIKDFVLK